MNLQLILEAIEALGQLIPAIGQFVVQVHPANGQEQARVDTAITTVNSALSLAGIAASTIATLQPTIGTALGANLNPKASAPNAIPTLAQTLANPNVQVPALAPAPN